MTAHARRRTMFKGAVRNDEGSLLLVILFTIMITALVLVATATMITGLQKTQNSRDYTVALQAADVAFADATMQANLGKFGPTATSLTSGDTYTTVPGTAVSWQWTATRTNSRTWAIAVSTKGKTMTRAFQATLRGTSVQRASMSASSGEIRYAVDRTEYYEHGFFGSDAFTVTSGAPDFDGYNGQIGMVGSNGNLTLGSASLDRINEWHWTVDSGRCTGTVCPTANGGSGSAQVGRFPQSANFLTDDITTNCATTLGTWTASSGAILQTGRCYDSLNFDASRTIALTGVVYVKAGGVSVSPGVAINTVGNQSNAAASNLPIATLGGYTQGAGSQVALAVYAPNGACTVSAASDMTYKTLWMGAATCKTFNISGNARFRYDGGLDALNTSRTATTSTSIWGLYDYQSVN